MKNFKKVFTLFACTILFLQNIICLGKESTNQIIICGKQANDEVKTVLLKNQAEMVNVIRNIEDKNAEVMVGDIIGIIGEEEGYVAPIYVGGKLEFFAYITKNSGQYSFAFSKNLVSEALKIKGESCFFIDSDNKLNIREVKEDAYDSKIDIINDNRTTIPYAYSSGSTINKTLDVVIISNTAATGYGYCWLASALSICRFYGSATSIYTAHTRQHGSGHLLGLCPGGTINDAWHVINDDVNKSGSIFYSNNNAAKVIPSINDNKPIYMELRNGNIGHAAVICGYSMNTSNGQFTYVIADSNYSNYIYQIVQYSDSTFTYTPAAGVSYNWYSRMCEWN